MTQWCAALCPDRRLLHTGLRSSWTAHLLSRGLPASYGISIKALTCAAWWGAGKYLFVKEPNKPLLHLYAVPDGAFEQNYADEPLAEGEQQDGEAKQNGHEGENDEDDQED